MGCLVFTILLLPAILLYAAVQALISPFAGVLAPVLALLNDPVFVYWMLRVLLVWNILVSAALVLVRRSMKLEVGVHPRCSGLAAAGTAAGLSGTDSGPVVGDRAGPHFYCFDSLFVILFPILAKE